LADFFDGQPLDATEPDNLGSRRVDLAEPLQNYLHRQAQFRVDSGRIRIRQKLGDELGWDSLPRELRPCTVDQDLLHRSRGDTKEMFFPKNSRSHPAQFQKQFADQSSGLERVSGALLLQKNHRDRPQPPERHSIEGILGEPVAPLRLLEQDRKCFTVAAKVVGHSPSLEKTECLSVYRSNRFHGLAYVPGQPVGYPKG